MFDKSHAVLPQPYRWTPATQRRFLQALAQTGSIKRACFAVSMARQAAYAFRRGKNALANTPIQCQLPEKSALSEMAIPSPPCAACDERASRSIALIELQEHP